MHCLINKDSHMKHVCRRCLTAFSSEPVLLDHMERCINQQPTNITFSKKEHLKFEDHHMKLPLPIRVYADFECTNQPQKNPKVLFKQIPIAVGYYIISPFGNKFNSHFGVDCTEGQQSYTGRQQSCTGRQQSCIGRQESCISCFVNEMLTLEKIASNYFKTNLQ